MNIQSSYLKLHQSGELQERADRAQEALKDCQLCPHQCRVNRTTNEIGFCRVGNVALFCSSGTHYGEERPLVGSFGSGTVFFGGCNLHCQFCQNYDISQTQSGRPISPAELAAEMLILQERGCHNINLVSPSHIVPQFLSALVIAIDKGLNLPIVYNSGGYDSVSTLKLLEGIIDIYMPDMKYADSRLGEEYSQAANYAEINQEAVKEMHRQVGNLKINADGIATRGLMIRHLVMPSHLDDTDKILKFIAEEISQETYVNIMFQYHPCFKAREFPELSRLPSSSEKYEALAAAKRHGLTRLD